MAVNCSHARAEFLYTYGPANFYLCRHCNTKIVFDTEQQRWGEVGQGAGA